jgi:regulator of replication initiation timing
MALHVGLNAVALHDELLAAMPDGARHDQDLCQFCSGDKATQIESRASVPSGPQPSGASTHEPLTMEGGTPNTMSENANETISRETHDALLQKAIKDATSTTEAALGRKTEEASQLAGKVEKLEADNATLTTDNERLNKELDKAQVSLKTATDEVASLKADVQAKDEAARKAEVASKRAEQVSNLGLFPKEYIAEKASKWADASDEDWAERIEEWQKAKPAATTDLETKSTADTASAMTGTSGDLTKDTDEASNNKPRAGRAVLGLN